MQPRLNKWKLAGLGAVILSGALVVLAILAVAAKASTVDRCPNAPDVLKVVDGAHQRAQKGWNSRTVEKDHETIVRVRTQKRCVPTQKGRRYVRWQIHVAKAEFRRAKRKALAEKLYDNITSEPGQDRLAVLRSCESGGRYYIYYGAYGMKEGWAASLEHFNSDPRAVKWQKLTGDGPTSPPGSASHAEQDIRASLLYQHGGWWACAF